LACWPGYAGLLIPIKVPIAQAWFKSRTVFCVVAPKISVALVSSY
jgi:hypothetical protein